MGKLMYCSCFIDFVWLLIFIFFVLLYISSARVRVCMLS